MNGRRKKQGSASNEIVAAYPAWILSVPGADGSPEFTVAVRVGSLLRNDGTGMPPQMQMRRETPRASHLLPEMAMGERPRRKARSLGLTIQCSQCERKLFSRGMHWHFKGSHNMSLKAAVREARRMIKIAKAGNGKHA